MSRYARDPVSGSILRVAGGGGDGSGGHTIVNESGTELTQRSKLQFIGANVTDDETNDTTVVEVENDVNLDIIAPTEVSPSTHAYEVGEQFIYNDNLYTATSNIAVGDNIVPEGSTPIPRGNCILSDAIVDQLDQSITISYAEYQQLTPEQQANGDYYIPDYPSQPGYADNAPREGSQAYVTSDGLNRIIGTEDISGIGTTLKGAIANLSSRNNYSTTEQVVGTWIDGKPLYQKTILKGGGFTKGAWNGIAHGITNLYEVHFAEGILKITQNGATFYHQLGGFRDANYCSELQIQPTMIQVYIGNTEETVTINKYEVTIQYTKTTD